MKITVGEKTIEAKIMEKEKAQEKYDSSITSGKIATMMKEVGNEFL
jgi:hypothetical protein